jgi:hypothetical protein
MGPMDAVRLCTDDRGIWVRIPVGCDCSPSPVDVMRTRVVWPDALGLVMDVDDLACASDVVPSGAGGRTATVFGSDGIGEAVSAVLFCTPGKTRGKCRCNMTDVLDFPNPSDGSW